MIAPKPYFTSESAALVRDGGIAIIPTDTLYGIVTSALQPLAVERLYALRRRDADKPCIILLSNTEELSRFGVRLNIFQKRFVASVWPGAVSVVLPVTDRWRYLHRGGRTLAFRVPAWPELQTWLSLTGPVLAPSANHQGEAPATTTEEACSMFGPAVECYLDGGKLSGQPSTLVRLDESSCTVLRQGPVEIPKDLFLQHDSEEYIQS